MVKMPQLERLQQALYAKQAGFSRLAGDPVTDPVTGGVELQSAAVFIPIIQDSSGAFLLLTVRASHLRHHAGQVSFPGGRLEPSEEPSGAALRELEEEIGHPADHVQIWGELPLYRTGTGFLVTPFIGELLPPHHFRPDPSEVASIFMIPVDHAFDLANYHRQERVIEGKQRHFWTLDWPDHFIWGATAGMLHRLVSDYHQLGN